MTKFSVTFERYLPHDDEDDICEPDERGFIVKDVSLREAMRNGLEYVNPDWAGPCEADCYPLRNVRWLHFYEWNDCTRDFFQGIRENRSLHFPPNITEASRLRICKLFGVGK